MDNNRGKNKKEHIIKNNLWVTSIIEGKLERQSFIKKIMLYKKRIF